MTKCLIQDFEKQKKLKTCIIEVTVEPDASTACYFLSAALLQNKDFTLSGLGKQALQPDVHFYKFLKKLGANIVCDENQIKISKKTISPLKGGFVFDFSPFSDQALTAAVLSVFADEPITITGIAHIRNHESNRISCLVQNFKSFGWKIDEHADGFTVYPVPFSRFKTQIGAWHTHHDHRFAMSGALLKLKNNKIKIQNPSCVSKTCPKFFEYFRACGQLSSRGLTAG